MLYAAIARGAGRAARRAALGLLLSAFAAAAGPFHAPIHRSAAAQDGPPSARGAESGPGGGAGGAGGDSEGAGEFELADVVVRAFREVTAASDSRIRAQDFLYLPRQTSSDLLRMVPGIHVQQHTGGGKAHQMFLRGFDAEHGQDLAGFLDGVPLNEVSHVHGQGYLDLHFLIPEVLREMVVSKGGYSTSLGNFSTAGAVDFIPDYDLDRSSSSLQWGMFGAMRGLACFAGDVGGSSLLAAAECSATEGFTDPGRMDAARAFASMKSEPWKGTLVKGFLAHYNATYEAADVIPVEWIDEGLVDRFGSMDQSDGGESVRDMLSIAVEQCIGDATLKTQAYYCYKKTAIFSNYTFYLFDRVNGDQHGLRDERSYGGLNAVLSVPVATGDFGLSMRAGFNSRLDSINLSQANTRGREALNRIYRYDILEAGLGFFAEAAANLSGVLKVVAGIRADAEHYDVSGRQDVMEFDLFTNTYMRAQEVPRSAKAVLAAASPKISAVLTPHDEDEGPFNRLRFFADFGMGATPPRAQSVANFNDQSMPRSFCAEAAFQVEAFGRDLSFQAVCWWADKDSELVFEPESGLSADRGPSRRYGLEMESRLRLAEWIYAAADFYWTRAYFRDGSDPVPGTPELMFSGNLSLRHPSGFRGHVKCRAMGPRPLTADVFSRPYLLFDVMLGYEKAKSFGFEIGIENVFDVEWDDTSFHYDSRPDPDGPAKAAKHITPGTPFSLKATFTVFF